MNSDSLFDALETKGWTWEAERLYAPKRTFWTEGTRSESTPLGMVLRLRERIATSLESLKATRPTHLTPKQHEDLLSDMESLVNTTEELLKSQMCDTRSHPEHGS